MLVSLCYLEKGVLSIRQSYRIVRMSSAGVTPVDVLYELFTPPVGRGLFQVMDKTDSIYIIEDLVSGKRITTHIHNLRPFIYDPIRTNPWTVAQHNEQEFIVESILGQQSTIHPAIQRQMVWIRRVQRQLGTVQGPHACGQAP